MTGSELIASCVVIGEDIQRKLVCQNEVLGTEKIENKLHWETLVDAQNSICVVLWLHSKSVMVSKM